MAESGMLKTYPLPHVYLLFKPHIGARIYRLTFCIYEEVLDLIVADKVICSPTVHEPLGIHDRMAISVYDMA